MFNKGNSILFIDSTNIKIQTQTEVEILNNRALGIQKGPTTKLYLCCTASYSVVSRLFSGNYYYVLEERKLIESIYYKNNNYLLMDRAYEDNKTITAFMQSFFVKKIVNFLAYVINNFNKQRNIIK